MEKNEKLKALAAVAEGLGLTAEDVAAYFGKISVQSEETTAVDVICPGMYYYSDGTISSEILSEKQISGVVGWVDESKKHGLVLGLREAKLPWSGDDLVADAFREDGRENTRLILEAAQKQNKKAEAAEWCASYDFDGVQPGEAFLASKEELVEIFKNLGAIQEVLREIKQPQLEECDCYWSSSEYNYTYNAWGVRPSDGDMGNYNKFSPNGRVRCALAF